MKRSQFTDNQTAALIGRIVILEELVAKLMERVDQQDGRERQESSIRFLEERLTQLTRPRALLTEKEAAELLGVHIQSLKRWRVEHPSPRIPFISYEGGDVRYRVEDIESYLKSRERGAKAALRAA